MSRKNEDPFTLIYNYSEENVSDMLKPEFGKQLAKKVGDAASNLLSDESYMRLVKSIEADKAAKD